MEKMLKKKEREIKRCLSLDPFGLPHQCPCGMICPILESEDLKVNFSTYLKPHFAIIY